MTFAETAALIAGAFGVGKVLDTGLSWILNGRTRRMDIAERAQKIAGEALDDLEQQRDEARTERDREREEKRLAREILIDLIAGRISMAEAHDRAREHGII